MGDCPLWLPSPLIECKPQVCVSKSRVMCYAARQDDKVGVVTFGFWYLLNGWRWWAFIAGNTRGIRFVFGIYLVNESSTDDACGYSH